MVGAGLVIAIVELGLQMVRLEPDVHHHWVDRGRKAAVRLPDVGAQRFRGDQTPAGRLLDKLIQRLPVLESHRAAFLLVDPAPAPLCVEDRLDGRIHIRVVRRAEGLAMIGEGHPNWSRSRPLGLSLYWPAPLWAGRAAA